MWVLNREPGCSCSVITQYKFQSVKLHYFMIKDHQSNPEKVKEAEKGTKQEPQIWVLI